MNDENTKFMEKTEHLAEHGILPSDQTERVLKTEIEELRKKAETLDKLVAALTAPEASLFNMRDTVVRILHESGYLNLEEE